MNLGVKQTGFIEPVITSDQYVVGDLRIGAVEPVLEADGDWGEWDIIFDVQSKDFDSFNCTAFNTAQSISKILKRKYGIDFKPSPRWIGIMAGTDPSKGGNDPHKVCEAIRKHGLIPDDMLPWSDDIKTAEDYYSFKGADKNKCIEAGKKWLEEYEFKHDWVLTGANTLEEKLNNMKVSITFSPLGSAVYAWAINDKGQYVRLGSDNHWTEIRAFKDNPITDDSYEPFEKELAPDFNFFYVKRYIINKKQSKQATLNWIEKMLKWISEQLGIIQKQVDELPKKKEPEPVTLIKTPQQCLLEISYESLGKDLTPDDIVSDEIACATQFCAVARKLYPGFPDIPYTTNLLTFLKNDKRFKGSLDIEPGNVIIAITDDNYDNIQMRGHVGVVVNNGLIHSNDSSGPQKGLWSENFTVDSFVKRYRDVGGKKIHVFEPL